MQQIKGGKFLTKFRKKLSSIFSLGMIFLLLTILSVVHDQKNVAQAINNQITFQGKLTDPDGAAVADGTTYLKLSIYDAAAAGSVLYTAAGTVGTPTSTPVLTASGVFSINLGDTGSSLNALASSIFSSSDLYLGVTVCTGPGVGCDAEMTPRKRLTAAPYAFNADYLGGVTTSTQGGDASYIPATDSSGNLKLSNSLFAATSTAGQIGFGTSTVPTGVKAYIESTTAADKMLVLRANATQSGNLTEWQNASGVSLAQIGTDGSVSVSGTIATYGNLTTQGNLYLPDVSPSGGLIYSGASVLVNASGTSNIFVGKNAGNLTFTSGAQNSALGNEALSNIVSGTENTAVGNNALFVLSTGGANTAVGSDALFNNNGSSNTAVGFAAMLSNLSGINNVAIGRLAGYYNTGSNNVFLGNLAGYNEIGSNKLYISNSDTYSPLIYGEFDNAYAHIFNNLGVGPTSTVANRGLFYVDSTGSVSASSSISTYGNLYLPDVSPTGGLIYSGASVLVNASGTSNIFVGKSAGNLTFTSGGQNVSLGGFTLNNLTIGSNNAAVGDNALSAVTSGEENTSIGASSLPSINTGSKNTGLGFGVMVFNTAGNNNTAVGNSAGFYNLGDANVFLGYQAGYNELGSNKLYIANSNTPTPLIYGEFGNAYAHIFNNLGVGPTSTAANRGLFYVDSTGNVSNSGTLRVYGGSGAGVESGLTISATAATTTLTSTLTDAAGSTGFVFNTSVEITSSTPADRALAVFQNNGVNKVVITASGTIYSRSGIFAASSEYGIGDLAENVNIVPGEVVDAGNVVVVDMAGNNQYKKSTEAYAKNVAGVISNTGQFVIGASGANRAPLAIAGLVNVKVTAENGKINVGDYVVTASKPGYAMRYDAESGKSAGLVGMALEPLNEAEGTIKILVNKGLVAGAATGGSVLNATQNSNGQLVMSADLDLAGASILNVATIKGKDDKWQIDENGYFTINIQTSAGNKQLYGLQTGAPQELVLSGSSQLEGGVKQVVLDQIDHEIIDSAFPIKVTVTLTGDAKGVFVSQKNDLGFIVKELDGGISNATFDWMIIAKRKTVTVEQVIEETSNAVADQSNNTNTESSNSSSTVDTSTSTESPVDVSETQAASTTAEQAPELIVEQPSITQTENIATVETETTITSEPVESIVPQADLLSTPVTSDIVSE